MKTSFTSPLIQLLLMRWRIFLREPEAMFWTFGFPLVVTLILGIAFRPTEPEPLRVIMVDGNDADALEARLRTCDELEITRMPLEDAQRALRRGQASLIITPASPPQFRYDPLSSESRLARMLALDTLRTSTSTPEFTNEPVSTPGDRYVDFLVPGLIAMNVMMVCLWGIGWNIVEARARRLLRRLAVTPMRHSEYLGAFVIAHALLVLLALTMVLSFSALAFDVHIAGSMLDLLAISIVGSVAFSAIGILVASRTSNVEVLSGMINAISLTQIVASGVFFSATRFPNEMQPFLRALPLTALADGLRAIALEGRSFSELPVELGVLAGWTFVTGFVGLRLFRWS
jgi:ABC-type polysaccharide/polyol phosphate export permease